MQIKNTIPGIIEKTFPGIFDSENGDPGKVKHPASREDFFYQLAQNARDIIFHANLIPTLKFDYISPSCFPITGYTPEEFYADPLLAKKCWHEEDIRSMEESARSGKPMPTGPQEIRWVRKDGSIIWIEHVVTFEKDEKGKPVACQIIARDITARKKAELALQENQVFIAGLLEHAPHATVVMNPDASIRYANPAWEKLNGWTLSEVVGMKPPYPWWPEDQKTAWLATFLESLKRPTGKGELPSVKKNGDLYWISLNWSVVQHNGKTEYILINSVDVTERKKAEKALQDSEAKFSSAFNSSPDLMAITRVKDNKFIEVNESFVKISGYSREEALGHTPMELYSWVSSEDRTRMMKALKEKGQVYNEEFQFNTKNDGIHTMLFSMRQITVGDEPCYISISTDITERKKAEAALKASEQKFSTVYNSSPNAICLMNVKKHQFTEANSTFYRLTGYNPEDVIGHNHIDLRLCIKQEDEDEITNALRGAGRIFNKRVVCRTKNGGTCAGLFSAETVEIGGEKFYAIVITDNREQVKAELALRESEEKFSKAFKDSPIAICIFDVEANLFVDVNESFTRFTGYTREEAVGQTPQSLKLWVDNKEFREMDSGLQQKDNVVNQRIQSRMKTGEIRTGLFSAQAFDIGNRKHLILSITDITDQVKAELALRESEEKFSKAFKDSPEIIAITTLKDGRYVDVNDSYVHATGYSRDELIGNSTKNIDIWVNEGELNERRRLLIEQGRVKNKEYEFRTKAGEIRTWLYSAEAVTIGGESCLMSASIDITERKSMEQALANEAIRRRILIEQSSDGIVILDQNGKVWDVNWRFAEMLGYTMEEASQLYIWDWETGFARENLIEQLKNVDSDGDHFITHHRRKDGSFIDVDISTNGAEFAGQKLIFCVCRDISERNRMEKALRESEEKFSLAFNASPHMIAITDIEEGKWVEVNDSFVDITGYSREELIGHGPDEINMFASQEDAADMTKHLQEEGRLKNEVYNFVTKSGVIRTWLCSADVVSIGGKQRMLAIAADITENKKAEEALRESEEKFSRAFNASPISLSISRMKDMKFLEVNESFLRDKGYVRDEIIGKSSKEIGIWANGVEQDIIMKQLKTQGRVHNVQMQYLTKSGELHIGLVSAELIKIGNEDCMLVLNNDITQQKQAEEQLRLLSSVTKQVTDSTIITDPDLNITYMNQAAEDLFGYTFEEVKGKNLSFFNETPPSDNVKKILKETVYSGKTYSDIMAKRRKDGTVIICDCKLSPMYDENGKICSMIDIQRDITKQKDIETKLQEHKKLIDSIMATMPEGVLVIDSHDRILLANKAVNNILHLNNKSLKNKPLSEILPLDQYFNIHRAVLYGNNENNTMEFRYNVQDIEKIIYCVIVKMDGERTLITFSDVSREREEEEKLYLTDRLASIGEMAAGLAHELNNPLTGILTLSQLLVNSDIPAENKEDVECIYSEAKRAAGIVKNVLLFARNKTDDSGRACANEVVTDVLRLREYEQRTCNIKVVTELEENLPDVAIDKGQLQQVFLNMISNAEAAIKEANRPGILTVTTQRVNNHVNIHFSDNGCGIKKQVMPRIFDPFFTTKEVGKGTGLGLSICYSIIVKHGGKISVKSQVNEGTTFTIRMPIVP